MPKGPRIANVKIADDSGSITWSFGDDEKFPPIVLDMNDLATDVHSWLACHGVRQKVGDTWAGANGDVGAAYAGARRTIDMLLAGDLRAARVGDRSETIEVLVALAKGAKTEEQIAEMVNGADDERYKAIRAIPEVRAELASRAAKRAKDRAKKSGTTALADLFA